MKKIKRILAAALALTLLLGLSGCKKSDYKEAMARYYEGRYEEAIALFDALGDYEDSAQWAKDCRYELALEYLDDGDLDEAEEILERLGDYRDAEELLETMGAKKLLQWLREEGPQTYETSSGKSEVVVTAKGKDRFTLEFVVDEGGSGYSLMMDYKVEITLGEHMAEVTAEVQTKLGNAEVNEKGSGLWDISAYTEGGSIPLDEHSVSGRQINGNPVDANNKGLLGTGGINATQTGWLVEGLQSVIEDSGIDVTLADLGFTALK